MARNKPAQPAGSASSRYYRLYTLDSEHHIVDVREIRAAGDLEAINQVGDVNSGAARELWCGERRIVELPSSSVSD